MKKHIPVDCVYKVLTYLPSLTQRDACKIASVSPLFRAAADSNSIWEKFLPPDYEYFISCSGHVPEETLRSMSKKKLYFHLCDNPIETTDCHLQISLDKPTGKKILLVKAERFEDMYCRCLDYIQLIWPGSDNHEQTRSSTPYEIGYQANLESRALCPETWYVSYFLFKLCDQTTEKPFEDTLVKLFLNFDGNAVGELVAVLQPQTDLSLNLEDRRDGRKEIEIGEFFSGNRSACSILCIVEDYLCMYGDNRRISFEGIELRPKP